MDINTNIFRAYDIRGIAYEDLTEEIVSKLGKSLGTSSLKHGENLLIVARDGRNSSPDMYNWLSEGIKSTGCNVLNIGVVPTPLLYFSTFKLPSSSGVMITGSHNPSEYNGFKIVRNLKTISGEDIQKIKLKILENKFLTGKGSETEEEVVEIEPTFVDEMGLKASLTPSRSNGFLNMFKRVQDEARLLVGGS